MKTWLKKHEWQDYANCLGDSRFLIGPGPPSDGEPVLEDGDVEDVKRICSECRVRPECIKWAITDEVSSVWVAGVYLPDPAHRRRLRSIHERLRGSLPDELAERGEDI